MYLKPAFKSGFFAAVNASVQGICFVKERLCRQDAAQSFKRVHLARRDYVEECAGDESPSLLFLLERDLTETVWPN